MLKVFKLKNICFDLILFSTNEPFISAKNDNGDLTNNMVDPDPEMTIQHNLQQTFAKLATAAGVEVKKYAITRTVEEAIHSAASESRKILITGSLHLVGSALSVLDPDK